MKYLDEILALYPGKDPATRKFLLTQVFDQIPDRYSDEIVEVLWAEIASSEPLVRRQARYVLGQFFPRHAKLRYRLEPVEPGLWTGLLLADPSSLRAPPSLTAARSSDALGISDKLLQNACHHLEPLINAVVSLLGRRDSAPILQAASLVLGKLSTRSTQLSLAAQIAGSSVNFPAACAVAEIGGGMSHAALLEAVRKHGAAKPDLYLLLRGYPSPDTLNCLTEEADRAGTTGRANIAQALACFPPADCRPLLDRLIRRHEGWVTAYALDTLAGFGEPEDLPLIRLAYELETHEFIRLQAVRAAGMARSGPSVEFCLERVRERSGRIQSVALEALAGQSIDPAELAKLARPLLGSDFIRTRVQAILIMARADPESVIEPITKLVLSDEPLLRREAAFLLGYLQGSGSLRLLGRMAQGDGSPEVRIQAVKSLGKYRPGQAVPVLVDLLGSRDAALLIASCRTLSGFPENAAPEVADALRKAFPALRGAAKSGCLRALGALLASGAGGGVSCFVEALSDPDPKVQVGALEGLKLLGDEIPAAALAPLLSHADPRIAARATAAALLSGAIDKSPVLLLMLESSTESTILSALNELLDLAQALHHVTASPRFSNLATALSATRRAVVATHSGQEAFDLLPLCPPVHRKTHLAPVLDTPLLRVPRKLETDTDDELSEAYTARLKAANGPASAASRAPGAARNAGAEAGAARALPRWAWPALAAVVLCLVGFLAVRPRPAPPPAYVPVGSGRPSVDLEKIMLRLWALRGECLRQSERDPVAPVRPPYVLQVGDEIQGGRDCAVKFQDKAGNAIHLGEGGRFKLAAAAIAPAAPRTVRYTFEDVIGECRFEFERSGELELRSRATSILVANGSVEVRDSQGIARVKLLAGSATVLRDGKPIAKLAQGESTTLP